MPDGDLWFSPVDQVVFFANLMLELNRRRRWKPLSKVAVAGAGLAAVTILALLVVDFDSAKVNAARWSGDDLPQPEEPVLAEASADGQSAIGSFQFPKGLSCKLFAAEPDVANVVAFHRDYQGNVYACESYRQAKGIEDNRNHSYWVDDDLQAQTIQDRIDYILKHHPEAKQTYTKFDDRIRVLQDADDDGKVDVSKVFAKGFNAIEMGTGAGVLSYRDKVYYTCIPNLFELRDDDGDLVADSRKSLSSGYGVRFALRGHDCHGLIVGPDGRLYFSIGDRGYDIAPNMRDPASGAVFRCELDGSDLEVFATGLRNPQELAFDEYGDLFTGDNNSDGGDEARWTYVVPGGDSGWRMYFQYVGDRGPWNREAMWDDENDDKPAYIIPCIKNISDGPSGLEYYPGTGFGKEFDRRFFMCDFRGQPRLSGVRSFRNKRKGAFYELVDDEKPIWAVLTTDIDFGSDGKLYLSDWVSGWNGVNKGRIYTYFDEKQINTPIVKEVEAILRDGLKETPDGAIIKLFTHKDQRVRQEAQFELVRRGEMDLLLTIVNAYDTTLPRIHAIWGLSQLLRSGKTASERLEKSLLEWLSDDDQHVRREAAKLAGDFYPQYRSRVERLCSDKAPKVQYQAALAIGKIGVESSMDPICKMLVSCNNADPIVRHGGIMAIRGIAIKEHSKGESTFIDQMVTHESAAVRLATVVALRKQFQFNVLEVRDNTYVIRLLGRLLDDADKKVSLEAASAVHDLQIDDVMEPLAKLIVQSDSSNHLIRRAISANNRIGDADSANRLGDFIAKSSYNTDLKLLATRLLGKWKAPDPHDPVTNAFRTIDVSKRKVEHAAAAVNNIFAVLKSLDQPVIEKVIGAAAELKVKSTSKQIFDVVVGDGADSTRTAALSALETLEYEGLDDVLSLLDEKFESIPPQLASRTIDVLSRRDRVKAIKMLGKLIQSEASEPAVIRQKQEAFATLGNMQQPESEAMLDEALGKLKNGSLANELELDVLKACLAQEGDMSKKAEMWLEQQSAKKVRADRYTWALSGGDALKGRDVFRNKSEVSCLRCHQIKQLGGKVGPNLSMIGVQYDRRGILESIVDPNLKIANGFGQIIVATDDGLLHTGIVTGETDETLSLLDADGKVTEIEKETIEGRRDGKSSMPEDLASKLTRDELRDLIAYLATCVEVEAGDKVQGH